MSSLAVTHRQRRRIVAGSLVLLMSIVAAVVALGGGDVSADRDALPTASFELFDGGTATFADFGGKPLVINFWASWCPACVAELPDIQAVHEALGDEVTFLGVANADSRVAAIELADDVGLTYTLADDPKGDLFRSLGLIAMPSTIFVTADGQIQDVFGGQLDEKALIARIEGLVEAS